MCVATALFSGGPVWMLSRCSSCCEVAFGRSSIGMLLVLTRFYCMTTRATSRREYLCPRASRHLLSFEVLESLAASVQRYLLPPEALAYQPFSRPARPAPPMTITILGQMHIRNSDTWLVCCTTKTSLDAEDQGNLSRRTGSSPLLKACQRQRADMATPSNGGLIFTSI